MCGPRAAARLGVMPLQFATRRAGRPRYWRPLPLETVDTVCGEGNVAAQPVHAHDAVQVILPGSRFAVTDGRSCAVVVGPGDLYVAAPLELIGAQSLDGEPCVARVILVGPSALSRLRVEPSELWRGTAPGGRQFVLHDPGLYAELWTLVGDLRGPLVSLACGARLLGCLTRVLTQLAPQPVAAANARSGRQVDGVRRVCAHLRAHVADNVSLDDLARVAGLSKFYLLRAFRRAHGVTPHAYQMQLRLAHAWRLIVDGRPLSRTTYDAGFADQSHLTRRFAEVFGLTPARYARELALLPGVESASASGISLPAAA
jgi:AraC-like DNA-binding protein